MPVGAPCPNWGKGCTCEDCTFPGEPPYVDGLRRVLVSPVCTCTMRNGFDGWAHDDGCPCKHRPFNPDPLRDRMTAIYRRELADRTITPGEAATVLNLIETLEWYAERRNYLPAGGGHHYDALIASDAWDDGGPGARARAALGRKPS